GVLAPPLGLVPVDVAVDLTGPGAERPDVRRELLDLPGLGVQGETVLSEDRPELRVGGDRGVPDAVYRLDHVAHTHRVEATPGAFGEDPSVDLEVQVTMGIAGPRRVVPDHGGLNPLDRHLDLPSARPDPSCRVPGAPADDLGGRLVLGFVQRGR